MDVSEFRVAGHRVVERLAEYFDTIESKAVFPDADPRMIAELFNEPLPDGPEPLEDVLAELEEKLLPYCTHVGHPGYMGLLRHRRIL
jgi:aromatic-L-amino-acid decarboxylase